MLPFTTMSLEYWNTVLNVNLTGQFLCAREAIREFLRRGVVPAVSCAAGKIICMSSVHQQIPWGGHANYAASKGGIKLLMESIAQEFAPASRFASMPSPLGPSAPRSIPAPGILQKPTPSS